MIRYLAIIILYFILGNLFNCRGHHQDDSTSIETEVIEHLEGQGEYDIEDEAELAGEVENPSEVEAGAEENPEDHPEDNPED